MKAKNIHSINNHLVFNTLCFKVPFLRILVQRP